MNLKKIQMILVIENCFTKSNFGLLFRALHYVYVFTKYNNFLGVCSILAKNLTNFAPHSRNSITRLTLMYVCTDVL